VEAPPLLDVEETPVVLDEGGELADDVLAVVVTGGLVVVVVLFELSTKTAAPAIKTMTIITTIAIVLPIATRDLE
jgi:hypothetical protein